jgi:hypothetical protein
MKSRSLPQAATTAAIFFLSDAALSVGTAVVEHTFVVCHKRTALPYAFDPQH